MSHSQSKAILTKSLDMSSAEIVRARRACTVPQQLLKTFELPSLPTAHTVPKRYEETKPVKVQNFTHQRIMDLGEYINRQAKEEAERSKQLAVEKAIAETWEAAHEIKMQAVAEALQKAQAQHEKQLKRAAKQHHRALQEEVLTVETMMQNKMREELQSQRVLADQALAEAVTQVNEQCAIELLQAVEAARGEEREEARIEKASILQDAAQTLRTTKDELAVKEKCALVELENRKDSEQVDAVKVVRVEELEIRTVALTNLKEQHAAEIQRLEETKAAVESTIYGKDEEIVNVQQKREQLYNELLKVQADYQNFIDKHPLFDPGQTGYLLADVNANPNIINPYEEQSKDESKNTL